MVTDIIKVGSYGKGYHCALEEAAKFAVYEGLDKKKALWIRLLAEETLGMIDVIAGNFEADFWLDSDTDKVCRLHLVADTHMNYEKKQDLIEISSDKKNALSKGFMGKIREMIENGLMDADAIEASSGDYGDDWYMYGGLFEASSMSSYNYQWSLERYRSNVDEVRASQPAAEAAWDELEKSIVANIADDVRVGIKGNTVEMVIEKKLY